MNYNGNFNKTISRQINQARRAMYGILSKANKLELPIDLQIELFNQLVLPILLYGSEVWGYQNVKDSQRKFLKQTLKLNRSTPNCMVYGESCQHSVCYNVFQRMINYWLRINDGKECKLSCIMYRIMYNMLKANVFKFKWICKIKYILDLCVFS